MNFKTIFPYIVIVILMFFFIKSNNDSQDNITIPQKEGSFVVNKPQPITVYDTIYRDSIVLKENPVNQDLLQKYQAAQDTIAQLQLYKEAITIRNYKEVFTDEFTTITVNSQTTGTLDRQQIDYTIHSQQIDYKNPTEGLYLGLDASFPYQRLTVPSIGVKFSLINNNKIYELGINSNQQIKIGASTKLF